MKLSKLIFLIAVSVSLTNCASILNPKKQKVMVQAQATDSKVYVDGELCGSGSQVQAKLARDGNVKQIRIDRDGYKSIYKVHFQSKKSPYYIMSVIPFGVLFYPIFMDVGVKSYDYDKKIEVSEKPLKISKRGENERYVYLKNTSFDVKKEDLKVRTTKNKNFKKGKHKSKNTESSEEDVKFDNSIFSDAVYEILKDNNYSDTTKTVFVNKTNSLYLSAKVSKVDFNTVWAVEARRVMWYIVTSVEIEWEVFDLYDQSKFKKSFKSTSGEFVSKKDTNGFTNSLEDAINVSFFNFMNESEMKKLILKGEETREVYETLSFLSKNPQNLEEALKATVTVKSDKGHGSGCVVSQDGYIVTNFHVVAKAGDKLKIINNDGLEVEAKLIRKSEELDLALLKVNSNFEYSFKLINQKNYSVGDDIFVIGTPESIELSQSLTKGIISGTRKNGNNVFIQIDASVNSGNSGGALVKKSGEFVGVINAKLFGLGVEGLGFSIPSEKVMSGLYIKN
ncbi:MAG: S1C family serine protease [Flavobacterium sp.]